MAVTVKAEPLPWAVRIHLSYDQHSTITIPYSTDKYNIDSVCVRVWRSGGSPGPMWVLWIKLRSLGLLAHSNTSKYPKGMTLQDKGRKCP